MLNQYLPLLSAIAVALFTFLGNYYVGKLKNNVDVKTLTTNANEALRDDLLILLERYEKREESLTDRITRYDKQNDELQSTITTLRSEIGALRIENQGLKAELQQTRHELEKFERKVYYVPPKEVKE